MTKREYLEKNGLRLIASPEFLDEECTEDFEEFVKISKEEFEHFDEIKAEQTACKEFWCVEMNCPSYHTGEQCRQCEKYERCENCILQNDTPSPEHCKSICDQICYGFYEEGEEEW